MKNFAQPAGTQRTAFFSFHLPAEPGESSKTTPSSPEAPPPAVPYRLPKPSRASLPFGPDPSSPGLKANTILNVGAARASGAAASKMLATMLIKALLHRLRDVITGSPSRPRRLWRDFKYHAR